MKGHRKSQARQLGTGIINLSIGPITACLVPNQATLILGSHPMYPSTTALHLPRNQQYRREQRNRKWKLTEHTVKLGGESRTIIALGNGARACQTGSQRDFFLHRRSAGGIGHECAYLTGTAARAVPMKPGVQRELASPEARSTTKTWPFERVVDEG